LTENLISKEVGGGGLRFRDGKGGPSIRGPAPGTLWPFRRG